MTEDTSIYPRILKDAAEANSLISYGDAGRRQRQSAHRSDKVLRSSCGQSRFAIPDIPSPYFAWCVRFRAVGRERGRRRE